MSTKVTYNYNWSTIKSGEHLDSGLLDMVTDIQRRAVINAPRATGALVNSGKITKIPKGYKLSFGSARVPYAVIRHFENKKNPQTLMYLFRAADSVVRGNVTKYWKGKI